MAVLRSARLKFSLGSPSAAVEQGDRHRGFSTLGNVPRPTHQRPRPPRLAAVDVPRLLLAHDAFERHRAGAPRARPQSGHAKASSANTRRRHFRKHRESWRFEWFQTYLGAHSHGSGHQLGRAPGVTSPAKHWVGRRQTAKCRAGDVMRLMHLRPNTSAASDDWNPIGRGRNRERPDVDAVAAAADRNLCVRLEVGADVACPRLGQDVDRNEGPEVARE